MGHRILLAAGSNAKGQLGIGTYDDAHTFTPCQFAGHEPNQLPALTSRVAHVACGANHTVLLLERHDGSTALWGVGDGGNGQLGTGYPSGEGSTPWTVFRALVVPVPGPCTDSGEGERGYGYTQVAAAWETTYVVFARPGRSDVLLSMGSNAFGALGAGEGGAGVAREPRVVDFGHVFSDDDDGRDDQVEQRRTISVRSLCAGPRHVVAELIMTDVDADGSLHSRTALVGWGASRHGQLGQICKTRFIARPTRLPIDIEEDPMVACALGNQHTVVLHVSGRISALGSNRQGQIPSLASRMRIYRLGCTWSGTYVQTMDGNQNVLISTGNNAQGQLGRGRTVESTSAVDAAVSLPVDRAVSNFVCGSEHVLAAMSGSLQEVNSVVGWGWNEHGNMGLGSLGNITTPTQLWPRQDMEVYHKYPQKVVGTWAGCATSWLLVE